MVEMILFKCLCDEKINNNFFKTISCTIYIVSNEKINNWFVIEKKNINF